MLFTYSLIIYYLSRKEKVVFINRKIIAIENGVDVNDRSDSSTTILHRATW